MESSGSDAGATASAAAVEKRRKEEEVVRVLRRVEARSFEVAIVLDNFCGFGFFPRARRYLLKARYFTRANNIKFPAPILFHIFQLDPHLKKCASYTLA